jgi:predicted DNA-binding transcriptional regulator AlpA
MTTTLPLLEDQFIDMAFITRLTGLTDKWFYKLIKDGEFPKPTKFGRSSRWLQSEVEVWLLQRINASRGVNSTPSMTSHSQRPLTITAVKDTRASLS